MAQYNLSGQGIQTLNLRLTGLFVKVTARGASESIGLATPTNLFHVGLFRLGSNGYFGRVIPLDADQCWITLPDGVDALGYNLKAGTTVTVGENGPPV